MKFIYSATAVFLLAFCVFAQNSQVKFYQGEDFKPFMFEPYREDYAVSLGVFGLTNIDLRGISTEITETADEWRETQIHSVGGFGEIGRQTVEIDSRTGLTKKFSSVMPNGETIGSVEITFENNKISMHRKITKNDGKIKADNTYNFEVKEKFYPCYSAVMHSYMPLDANFSAAFNCFWVGTANKAPKQILTVTKVTFTVICSEKVAVGTETFDCYKIAVNTYNAGYYDGNGVFQSFAKEEKAQSKKSGGFFGFGDSYQWIDKRTRILTKAEFQNKTGTGVFIELQRNKRNL